MKNISNKKRVILIALITILSVVVYGSFFPILNFSSEKPTTPLVFTFLNIVIFYLISDGIGTIVPTMFPQWTLLKIAYCNFAISAAGLLVRYFLEFGEISNTYNFTVFNVAFHLFITVGLATLEAKKTMSKEK